MTDHRSDDALLAEVLAHRSTWVEPPEALEDLVVQAVLGAPPSALAPVTPIRPALVPQSRPHADLRRGRALFRSRLRSRRSRSPAAYSPPAATSTPTSKAGSSRADRARRHGRAEMHKTDAGFRVELDARSPAAVDRRRVLPERGCGTDGTAVPIGTSARTAATSPSGPAFPRNSSRVLRHDRNRRQQSALVPPNRPHRRHAHALSPRARPEA